MATPLMWKALALSQNVYNRLLYRYIIHADTDVMIFFVERNQNRLIPLYSSFAVFAVTVLFSLKIIIKFIIKPLSISLDEFVCTLGVILVYILFSSLNLIIIVYANEFARCLSMLSNFHGEFDDIFQTLIKRRDMELRHSYLLQREIIKLFKGIRPADKLGVLINLLVVGEISFGLLFTPLFINCGYDAVTLATREWSLTPAKKYGLLAFKYIIYQWCTLEALRVFSFLIIFLTSFFNTIMDCLRKIKLVPSGIHAIFKYQQLRYILTVGCNPIKYTAGVTMLTGPVGLIVCNIILICLGEVLPTELYFIFVFASGYGWAVMLQSVPVIAECREFSKHLLRQYWCGKGRLEVQTRSRKEFIIWRKMVKAQETLQFYYGVAIFEHSTKTNLYENIIDYTINISLLLGQC